MLFRLLSLASDNLFFQAGFLEKIETTGVIGETGGPGSKHAGVVNLHVAQGMPLHEIFQTVLLKIPFLASKVAQFYL